MNFILILIMLLPVSLFAADHDHHLQVSKKRPALNHRVQEGVGGEVKIDVNRLKGGQKKLEDLPRPSNLEKKVVTKAGHKRSASLSDLHSKDSDRRNSERSSGSNISAIEDYTPKAHPILSKSRFAKAYVECTTTCCFVGEKLFKGFGFLSGVATCALAGVAYGVSDPVIKDNLNLGILILTVGSAALKKLENYAHAVVHDQEKESKMFIRVPEKELAEIENINPQDDLV